MYSFNADLYCDDCGERIRARLDAKGVENSGDSGDYPQYFDEDYSETDAPTHCASGEDCRYAIDVGVSVPGTAAEAGKVGALLMESLTTDGEAYVRRAIAAADDDWSRAVTALWADAFGIEDESEDDE